MQEQAIARVFTDLKLDFHSVLFVARSTFCDSFLLNCEPSTGTDPVEGSQFKRKRSQKSIARQKALNGNPPLLIPSRARAVTQANFSLEIFGFV